MKIFITLLAIITVNSSMVAQDANVKTENIIKPKLGKIHDISDGSLEAYRKLTYELKRIENDYKILGSDKIPKSDVDFMNLHEMDMSPHSTDTAGCSWYCAALISSVKTSNTLNDSEKYKASNIHDFDLSKTWATNKNKGIGEFITFAFGKSEVLSINQIQIYNGYQKSETTWKNNSRAKKIALSVNGKHYANLELKDVRNVQIFNIEDQRFMIDKNLTFEFKILEIYSGEKYEDLCISEINFDGKGDH